MVNRFLFKDRDGRTPLTPDFKSELTPEYSHINLGGELDSAEEENITDGLVWLDDQNGDPKDWMFWERLHKKLFENVWTWAGQFRKHELANEDFNHPGYIKQNIKQLEGDLKYWLSSEANMNPLEAMARFQEAFLTIHPFSNGNGRTSRILTEKICKFEKIQIPTWGLAHRSDPRLHRGTYINAVMKARHEQKFELLISFMFT